MKLHPLLTLGIFFLNTVLFSFANSESAKLDITITQVYDNLEAKQFKESEKDYLTTSSALVGKPVPLNTPIIVGRQSRFEIAHPQYILRVGGASKFEIRNNNEFTFSQGVILVQPLSEAFKLAIRTERSFFSVSGLGTFIMETTSNGGCKIIGLSDRTSITLTGGEARTIIPGKLVFVVPNNDQFGADMDIDLHALYSTSNLIHGFDQPLERFKALRYAVFFQMHEIEGKSNALIGDAKDGENFDVILME